MGRFGRSDAATFAATAVVAVGVAAGLGALAWQFLRRVLAGQSPSTFWWIVAGVILMVVGSLVGLGFGRLFKLDEDRTSTVSSVSALLVLALGLGASYVWVRTHEGPLATALGPACRGDQVTSAAELDPSGTNRYVVLDADGHEMSWTEADESWRAEEPEDAALVACVARRDPVIERCTYRSLTSGMHDITRYAQVLSVRVVMARTGKRVGRFTLRDEPRACRQVEEENQEDLHGKVPLADLVDAMQPYLGESGGS